MALFSMIVPFLCVALRIRTDFDCFKAGVGCAFAIDKLNSMYIFYSFLFFLLEF
jgi:hypothetical protein